MNYRYIGTRGEYLPGIPPRDLTHDELPAIAQKRRVPVAELQKRLQASDIYEVVRDEDAGKPAAKGKAPKRPKPAAPPEPPGTAAHPPLGPVQTAPDGTMVETQRAEPKQP